MKMPKPLTDRDGEVRELTKDDMLLFRPAAEVDPGIVEDMVEFRRKVGRPKSASPKVLVGFRLSADVVASIKASGPGYNVRIERILREAGFGGDVTAAKQAAAGRKRRPPPPPAPQRKRRA